jgi:hypothetical protein
MPNRGFTLVAIIVLCGASANCSESSTAPGTNSKTGQYIVNWERSVATCAPNALPVPQSSDTSLYARVSSTSGLAFTLTMDGIDADSVVTLIPKSSSALGLTMRGTWQGRGDSALFTRNTTRTEGARAGSRTFTVTEEGTDSANFLVLVLTPPGNGLSVSFFARGSGTATFREGGANGTVYTTCTFTESLSGSRSNQ